MPGKTAIIAEFFMGLRENSLWVVFDLLTRLLAALFAFEFFWLVFVMLFVVYSEVCWGFWWVYEIGLPIKALLWTELFYVLSRIFMNIFFFSAEKGRLFGSPV